MARLSDDRLAKHARDVADVIAQQGAETWWPVTPAWELQAMIAELQAARTIVDAIAENEPGLGERFCRYCDGEGVALPGMNEPITIHERHCIYERARALKAGTP